MEFASDVDVPVMLQGSVLLTCLWMRRTMYLAIMPISLSKMWIFTLLLHTFQPMTPSFWHIPKIIKCILQLTL
jgi:hypothetical protein